MDGHNPSECEDCTLQKMEANGHQMQMIIPCNEPKAYWACLTCDVVEGWPVTDDIVGINEILRAMLYIHCLDNLVIAQ